MQAKITITYKGHIELVESGVVDTLESLLEEVKDAAENQASKIIIQLVHEETK